ncbi:MAG: hypothetical protein ACI8RD_011886, partial [Bacillariaceae sp.]
IPKRERESEREIVLMLTRLRGKHDDITTCVLLLQVVLYRFKK